VKAEDSPNWAKSHSASKSAQINLLLIEEALAVVAGRSRPTPDATNSSIVSQACRGNIDRGAAGDIEESFAEKALPAPSRLMRATI